MLRCVPLRRCKDDPEGEACLQAVREFCSTNPEDTGCEFITLHFQRIVHQPASYAFHVPPATSAGFVYSVPTFMPKQCSSPPQPPPCLCCRACTQRRHRR